MGCLTSKKPVVIDAMHFPVRINDASAIQVTSATFVQLNSRGFQDVYKVGNRLGAGAFAEVRRCEHKVTGQVRAVKIYRKEKLSPTELQELIREAEVLRQFDHPNIVRIYEMFEDTKRYYIVMEHCKGGELFYIISSGTSFSEGQVAKIMLQLLSVVAYIHERGVVHRDIKPENILLEERDHSFDIKIVDFGTAARLGSNGKVSGIVGTPYYIAPEVMAGGYTEKCDEWSCGVIMYILLTGRPPFGGTDDKEILEKVKTGVYSLDIPEMQSVSKDAISLLRRFLSPASSRITAKQALQHSWLLASSHESHRSTTALPQVLSNLQSFTKGRKLREAVQTFIATQLLSAQETKELREVFREIDKNGDGKLSREELMQEYLKTMGIEEATTEVDRIMEKVDSDGSGFIDYTEFLKASLDMKKVLNVQNLEMTFSMFDTDSSGKISATEIKKLLGNGGDIDEEVWQGIIKEVDQNGDGEIDLVEFKELVLARM